jgi:ribosomal protein S18 acetylase RimI-like enzyme
MAIVNIQPNIHFCLARTVDEFDDARNLYQQYAASLNIDLGFQDFDAELRALEAQYSAPKGAVVLAYKEETPIGCVGIRENAAGIAELKRMYVQPAYRRYKIGMKLLTLALETAIELNYTYIRLDTLAPMTSAIHLYRSFGFYDIAPYRFNPIEGAVYMEKKLR